MLNWEETAAEAPILIAVNGSLFYLRRSPGPKVAEGRPVSATAKMVHKLGPTTACA